MEKILTLQLKRIGDLILTLPALAALRQSSPDAEVSVVLVDGCTVLAPLLPQGVRPIAYRRGKLNAAAWREIVFSKWGRCYDFTGSDRSTLMARLSRAGQKHAYRKAIEKKPARAKVFDQLCDASVRDLHTTDYHLALVGGLEEPDFKPHIPASSSAAVDQLLAENGVGDGFVVVHPGTARDEKIWPAERWGKVIDHLAGDRGLQVVLTGSPDEREQSHLSAVKAAASNETIDLSGKVDLVGLTELLRRPRLVLGVDSAAMHLAALWGTAEIALFGPTNPFHWRPRHPRVQILLAGQDSSVEGFQARHKAAPMDNLSTEIVIRAISTELA